MQVTMSDKLKNYMTKKKMKGISVSLQAVRC
jgi:hypothetical protein